MQSSQPQRDPQSARASSASLQSAAQDREDEALAESYGEIAAEATSVDDEINKALEGGSSSSTDSLAALKAKMGMNK